MRGIDGDVPVSHTWVMGLLSVRNTIRCPDHWWPHVSAAAIIAKNSLQSIEVLGKDVSQAPRIHFVSRTSQKPTPDASVWSLMSVEST